MRCIAVDWSGDKRRSSQRNKIWLAEAVDGNLVCIENGRTREEVCVALAKRIAQRESIVIGLDFAFSFPEWFCREQGGVDGETVWRASETVGEHWLEMLDGPFWDGTKQRRPLAFIDNYTLEFRETDREIQAQKEKGANPTSVFKLVGASQVGRGSVRGQPYLLRLREAGATIWPFDAPSLPLVVEIYSGSLTGEVVKSDEHSRAAYLSKWYPGLSDKQYREMKRSDDAFDAGVSALVMSKHAEDFGNLSQATDPTKQLEGEIWFP